MKVFIALMLAPLLYSTQALAAGGASVAIEPLVSSAVTQQRLNYQFRLYDSKSKKYLGENELAISHEKKLHFIVYDLALKEFQHVHPTFDGNYWNVDLNFNVSGNYMAWAQGKVNKGGEFSSSSAIEVQIAQPAWPVPPTISDVREGTDGISKITLSNTPLSAGQMVMLDLKFSRTDGTPVEITPYLGAIAHVIAVTSDGQELIHVHPMEGSRNDEGMLHATFPEAGPYRIWIEFIDGGTLKRAELGVEVQ